MKRLISFFLFLVHCSLFVSVAQTTRIVGGDLSMVPAYEAAGDKWLDADGKTIPDLLAYVKQQGWNVVRVRLFLDPTQDSDPATCQDYDYVLALAKRVKAAGMKVMLDLHYSDTWADPSTQKIPSGWSGDTSNAALASQLFTYSYETVNGMIREGAAPDYVQLGNEITYGFLWRTSDGKYPTNSSQYAAAGYCPTWSATYAEGKSQWQRTASLLNNAAHGVRQAFKDEGRDSASVKLIVHTEMGSSQYNSDHFYRHLRTAGFNNYDIVGLSYYPFWHGTLTTLGNLLSTFKTDFPDKEVQIVETAWYNSYYPFTADADNQYTIASLNPAWTADGPGMVRYLQDLVEKLKTYDHVTGLVYWMPEECGNGSQRKVMNGWLNRGLWKNGSGSTHAVLRAADGTTPVQALATFLADGTDIHEDAGEYYQNLGFETGDLTGWTCDQKWSTQWPKDLSSWASADVVRGNYSLELWNATTAEGSVISQGANLPKGRYTVTVRARANKSGFYLYANNAKKAIKAETAATWSVTTNVRNGILWIGIGTKESTTDNYVYADDFTVTYVGGLNDDPDPDDTGEGDEQPKENEYTDDQGILYRLWPESQTASVHSGAACEVEEVVIPAVVTVGETSYYVNSIEENAFYNNSNLRSVTIGKNVFGIWGSAFNNCYNLFQLRFEPGSVLSTIDSWAFYSCAIDSLDVPAGVTEITEGAFGNCWNLNYVALRGEVNRIDDFAFSKWSAEDTIYAERTYSPLAKGVWIYATQAPVISPKAFSPADVENDTLYVHYTLVDHETYNSLGFKAVLPLDEDDGSIDYTDAQGLRYKLWPESGNAGVVGYDAAHAPEAVSDWRIEIPETVTVDVDDEPREFTVTYIGEGAFSGHWTLTAATLPESLTSIGPWAFYNTGLSSIVVYDGVTVIEPGTFSKCWNLANAEFYGNLTSVGDFAFSGWAEEGCVSKGGPLSRLVLWSYTVPEFSPTAFCAGDIAEGNLYVSIPLVADAVYNGLGFAHVYPIADAVEAPRAADASAPLYDLMGRRLFSAPRRGIYLRRGRPFVVK
ncbi:MAG: glycosyl hydrolase 53 family protein [Bacteroidaceae bacterium]|nr:glycosyl hydrolase 53 family protein [Bacteroidaceae bacterium]